jgi:hypothetical protein
MALNSTTPSATTGAFAPPPTAAELHQSRKEVSWSATPKESDQETIKKRKMPITYALVANLSLITVFKNTLSMLKATDPTFISISKEDSTVTIWNATDADKISEAKLHKYFPATSITDNKVHCKLFAIASMSMHLLKKNTFGFYKWAGRKVWIFDSHATDLRNIEFIIYRDPKKVNRDDYSTKLANELNTFPLSEDDADIYNHAKDAEAFNGRLPKFHLQQSDRISSRNGQGQVSMHAITVHCQNEHKGFMVPFLSCYFEDTATKGQFMSHSMRNGQAPLHLQAYHRRGPTARGYSCDVGLASVQHF